MSHGCTVLEGMVHYVNQLNFESEERYEREMKEYKALLLSAATMTPAVILIRQLNQQN